MQRTPEIAISEARKSERTDMSFFYYFYTL